MTAGVDFDRRLEDWFAAQAPGQAPDRLLGVAMERVGHTPQRRGLGRRVSWAWQNLGRRQRLAITLVLLGLSVAAAFAAGALLLRPDPTTDLVLVTAGVESPEDGGLTVRVRAPDGTERTIATFDAATLGGTYAEGAAIGVSVDGYLAVPVSMPTGSSEFRIVDLRDPTAAPRTPDAQSMQGTWSPDGEFAMLVNAGGYVAFDAHRGISTIVPAGDGSPREILFRPVWALAGGGLHANAGLAEDGFGVLGLDGTFVPGPGPAFETGVGPRRTDPAGARLQCSQGEDFGCEDDVSITANVDMLEPGPVVYLDDEPTTRIADFSSAWDGSGLWLLEQTVADGPRTVRLRWLGADGVERDIATFDGPADDPDPNSFFEAAAFAGFSPNDDRIVVRVNGDGGSFGTSWLVDPASGERAPLDGFVGGWLGPDALDSPRPETEPIVEAGDPLRGEWAMRLPERVGAVPEGIHRLTVRRSTAALDAGFGQVVPFAIAAQGSDRLVFQQTDAALGCAAGSQATYGWSVAADVLDLAPVDDACPGRATLLAASFQRGMPFSDTGPGVVAAGATVLASAFGSPFRVTAPDSGGLTVEAHDANRVYLSVDPPGDRVGIFAVSGAAAEPCERRSDRLAMGPGIAGAAAHITGLADAGVTITPGPEVVIDGHTGPSFTVAGPGVCEGSISLLYAGDSPTSVESGSTVALIEPEPGHVLAVVVTPGSGSDQAWSDAVIGSIDFLDTTD